MEVFGRIKSGTINFKPSSGANMKLILSNAMMYEFYPVNGARVINIIKDRLKLNKFSPDQGFLIQKQISLDMINEEIRKKYNIKYAERPDGN
ncbi:hypothetical protein [Paraflavitalea speifideaquila]|uniref:hypothetical protein n=1 Tax=Paraflavitalea speifideaquila TaxID=3076558 RepID=UPI0028E5C27F|nr:hypothetical protein [Paraflavitalea speifideiaquila]